MPLRVAEKEGYIHAVNRCCDCPFAEQKKTDDRMNPFTPIQFWICEHQGKRKGQEVFGFGIPIWCPLPTPGENNKSPLKKLVDFLVKSKEEGSEVLSEEQFEKIIKLYFQEGEIKNA